MTLDCRHDDLVIWTSAGEPIAVECRTCGEPMSIVALLGRCVQEEATES